MAKKLYTVSIEHEIIVIAENEEEALYAAEDALRVDLYLGTDDMTVHPMSCLVSDWSLDSFPFGESGDEKTIGEWIEEGAAPEYTKLQQRLLSASKRKDVD